VRAGTDRPPGRSLDPRRLKNEGPGVDAPGPSNAILDLEPGRAEPPRQVTSFGSDRVWLFVFADLAYFILVIGEEFGEWLARSIGFARC